MNPAPVAETTTIAVTGLGRSGTTMLSRILLALKTEMGDNLTPQFAEDKDILLLIKARDLEGFAKYCRARDAQHLHWGFKCPALRGILGQAVPLMRNPRVIIIFRDILAVSQRNTLSTNVNLPDTLQQAARSYLKLVNQAQSISAPLLLISYEKALQYPQALVHSIAKFSCNSISENQAADIAATTVINADPRYIGSAK